MSMETYTAFFEDARHFKSFKVMTDAKDLVEATKMANKYAEENNLTLLKVEEDIIF